MNLIETLNAQIDNILHDYESLKYENDKLRLHIEELKNKKDELERCNQDMLLNIDKALAFSKVESIGKEIDVSH